MEQRDDDIFNRQGRIVREFLLNPFNKKAFLAFYRVCHSHSIAYLRSLQASGRILPLEKADREDPLADLACDLLGGLLQCRDDAPFFVVFDYFERHGFDNFGAADPKEIFWHLSVLIRGFIKKELSHLPGDRDPQTNLLKRRFKDILRESEYGYFIGSDGRTRFIHLAINRNNLRRDKPPLPPAELERITMQAFADSGNRREWCRMIFDKLDGLTEYQNVVKQSDLLATVIRVNAEHLELYNGQPTYRPSAEDALTDDMLEKARFQAVEYIKDHSLRRFLKQKRISTDESERFILAAEHYLLDLSITGNPDPIPEYFRLVMPQSQYPYYLKRYKYCFETVINEALEEFRRILKE